MPTTPPTPPPLPPDLEEEIEELLQEGGIILATPPGFGPPSHQQPTQDRLDPAVTTVTNLGTGKRPDGGDGPESPGPRTPKSGPSPAFTPDQIFHPDSAAFEGVIGTAVGLAGIGLNHKLSRRSGAWMPDDETVNDIAAPLARIAARHIKLSDNETANDLSDGLEAAVATAVYVTRSVMADGKARRPDPQFEPNQPVTEAQNG